MCGVSFGHHYKYQILLEMVEWEIEPGIPGVESWSLVFPANNFNYLRCYHMPFGVTDTKPGYQVFLELTFREHFFCDRPFWFILSIA